MTFPKTAATLPVYLCILLLLAQRGGHAQAPSPDALKFFNNFFVTGDYVVGGVGLWNSGSGTIRLNSPAAPMTAAPAGAEALAAFLYWEVVTSANPTAVDVNAGSTFNGLPLNVPLGTQLLPTSAGVTVGTQACQLNGGTSKRVHTFRADVLRFMDVDPATGLRVINKVTGYPVRFPNNLTTRTLGASLVVIYRHPSPDWPLNAIVMYDGTFVKQQPATLRQRIEWFYDSSDVPGRITYIAGSAQSNLGDVLTVDTDDTQAPLAPPSLTAANLFGGSAGNAWDNITRATAPLTGPAKAGGYLDTAIAPQSTGPLGGLVNDCIAMGAMIYRTQVNDSDKDGLLNKWETSASELLGPNLVPLPNLKAMGADPGLPDIFIEIGAMRAAAGTRYGSLDAPLSSAPDHVSVTDLSGHSHVPTPAALQMLGEAFAAKSIRLHIDVGSPEAYHALFAGAVPDPTVADAYLVAGSHARGGESILETACVPTGATASAQAIDCQFPAYPGTVSWNTGYQLYKAQFFDANRKDIFRYALYAHAKAAPKSLLPCLAGAGGPVAFDANGDCVNGSNPLFHVPAGISGSGEYPGGNFLISLGLWDNTKFVGTDFGVASTTMHEMGHTLGLGHGGTSLPNCKPNYPSVMNYLFQLSGLVDANGVPHLGYSDGGFQEITETSVRDDYPLPPGLLFQTSWYAPKLAGDTRTAAKRFCNGQKFDPDALPVATVRIDGTVGSPIDWDGNGAFGFGVDGSGTTVQTASQDVNFDGEPDTVPGGPTTTLQGYNDWTNLRLNQVGSTRNFSGISIGPLGVRLLSDGSRLLADGSVLLADGSRLLADGSRLLADGSRLLADGAQFLADGSVLLADGSVLLADGVRLLSDGSRLLADGSRLLADGMSPVNSDGSKLLADGARLLSDGSVLLADGSMLLADGSVFLADGSVLLADGVKLLSDGSVLLADGSPLLADGTTIAWEFAESTPQAAAESGNTPGPNSLTACVIGGTGVSACATGPSEPLHRVFLDWEPPNAGNVAHYRVFRVAGDTVPPGGGGVPVEVPGTQTSLVDPIELPNGVFTYFVDAVLDDEGDTVTPRSNLKTITAENTKPVADSQIVTVWEDFQSVPFTLLTGSDPDSAGVAFSVGAPANGSLTGTPPTVSYLSAANFNGPDSFTFTLRETSTFNGLGPHQVSDPATVLVTVTPVNDKPSFTKGPNQTVTQPVGMQTVVGWATGFDAGPPDEDASQAVLEYVVTNSNNGLFESQPAIAANGTLTYKPLAGASSPIPVTVTVQVRDNGGTAEGHGAIDTSDAQTFTITVNPVPATQISFVRTDAWLSTSTSNRKFDVKAEVLRNGVVVAEKQISNVTVGMGSSFSKAVYTQISPLLPSTPFGFTTSDTLSVRVSIKLSASSAGGNSASAEVRLWYNTTGNNSHLHAVRAGNEVKYYLVTANKLQTHPAQAPGGTQFVSVNVKQGEGYKALGTWSITGP